MFCQTASKAAENDRPCLTEYENNPSGTGIKHRNMPKKDFPVEQISWPELIDTKPYPAGFGFINRAWKHRLAYAGTYDKKWQDEQHPYPPHDFDYFHHQAANPELIMDGYLQYLRQNEEMAIYPLFPLCKSLIYIG